MTGPFEEPATDFETNVAAGFDALKTLHERMTPLLFRAGAWLFGGLIASNLILIPGLISLGGVDRASLSALVFFVCALPFNVAGLALLRLVAGLEDFDLDEVALQAFRDAEFPDIDSFFPPAEQRTIQRRRRVVVGLNYSAGLGLIGAGLTLVGLLAALTHVGAWIAAAFAGAVIASAAVATFAISHALPRDTPTEKALKQRYREAMRRQ